jgi:hypothetical protein
MICSRREGRKRKEERRQGDGPERIWRRRRKRKRKRRGRQRERDETREGWGTVSVLGNLEGML